MKLGRDRQAHCVEVKKKKKKRKRMRSNKSKQITEKKTKLEE